MRYFIQISKSLLLLFAIIPFSIYGQPVQLLPENGGKGMPGPAPKSFIIQWESLPTDPAKGNVIYEYVISDNHLCLKGCPGDTRVGKTTSTGVASYNFTLDKWYYWIIRGIYSNGDTTVSSGISSFRTESSGNADIPYLSLNTNPTNDSEVELSVEWFIDPDVKEIKYDIITEDGKNVVEDQVILLRRDDFVRKENHPLKTSSLEPGTYFISVSIESKPSTTLKLVIF